MTQKKNKPYSFLPDVSLRSYMNRPGNSLLISVMVVGEQDNIICSFVGEWSESARKNNIVIINTKQVSVIIIHGAFASKYYENLNFDKLNGVNSAMYRFVFPIAVITALLTITKTSPKRSILLQ